MNKQIAKSTGSEHRIAVVVVGSGGSIKTYLAEALDRLGCDLSTAEFAHSIAVLNAGILESAGCLPTQLTAFNHEWLDSPKAAEYARKALKLIEQGFDSSFLMVFEDWQLARLMAFWNRVFAEAGIEPKFVFAIPAADDLGSAVTASTGLGAHSATLLGLRLFLEAEQNTRGQSRAFVSVRRVGKGAAKLGADLARELGLVWPRIPGKALKSMEYPVAANTDHEKDALADHEWLTAVWTIAEKWADGNKADDDVVVLEAVLEALDEAAPAFVGLETIGASSATIVEELEAQLVAARHETAIIQARLRAAEAEQGQAEIAANQQQAELQSRVAHLESALLQRKAENDEGFALLNQAKEERRVLEQRVAELLEQNEKAQASLSAMTAGHNTKVRDLIDRIDAQQDDLEAAARERQERLAEVVKLSRMLATETASANRSKANLETLGRIATILELGGGGRYARFFGWLMPRDWHFRRVHARLRREGLFDAAAYLAANPDVSHAGVNPLIHYLRHGLLEGRPSGLD